MHEEEGWRQKAKARRGCKLPEPDVGQTEHIVDGCAGNRRGKPQKQSNAPTFVVDGGSDGFPQWTALCNSAERAAEKVSSDQERHDSPERGRDQSNREGGKTEHGAPKETHEVAWKENEGTENEGQREGD